MRLIINKLNEINCNKFGENDGISYFSNLMVDSDSYVPMKEEKLSLDLCANSTKRRKTRNLPQRKLRLALTSVTKLTVGSIKRLSASI